MAGETRTLAVLGATGRTGKCVVDAASTGGWRVRALVRPSGTPAPKTWPAHVESVMGDALDPAAVGALLAGCDAVVCLLGPARGSPPSLCAKSAEVLVQAMRQQMVDRLVCVTGALVGHPVAKLGALYRTLRRLLPTAVLADRGLQEAIVMHSSLRWTLVRPPRLTDGGATTPGRWVPEARVGALASISRRALAGLVMRLVDDETTVQRAGVALG